MSQYKSGNQLSTSSILIWRITQTAVWLVGAIIFFCLIFYPSVGVMLFWNILIPIAPALIVVAVGLWRNVCPLATVTLLPRHLGLSQRRKMSDSTHGILGLVSVLALYVIVPLRHAVFNLSGHATAILLFGVAAVGVIMGFFYEWKSAWCSSLCPIHPVEKMYGSKVLFALPNAHCQECVKCVAPCPDSTVNISPKSYHKTFFHSLSSILILGGLPGFIWGWFHVPDHTGVLALSTVFEIYLMPMVGLVFSLVVYWLLTVLLKTKYHQKITEVFAAAAVSLYYWYRIPALLGFGEFATDGMLVNLKNSLPAWSMALTVMITTIFFFWWIVLRKTVKTSWVVRPAYSKPL